MENNWIEVSVKVLVHRSELPALTAEQENHFKVALSRELGEYLPSGQDWLDCLYGAMDRAGITEEV